VPCLELRRYGAIFLQKMPKCEKTVLLASHVSENHRYKRYAAIILEVCALALCTKAGQLIIKATLSAVGLAIYQAIIRERVGERILISRFVILHLSKPHPTTMKNSSVMYHLFLSFFLSLKFLYLNYYKFQLFLYIML
jgi:hypothetical protein